MLQSLLRDRSEPFDTIVHLGAGDGDVLDLEGTPYATRLVLVEPHPQRAALLRGRVGSAPGATVIEAAVADHDGWAELQLFNLSRMDSLRAPTGACELFRGLRATGAVKVRATRPETLIGQLGHDQRRPNLLVVDLPAEALFILETLARTGQLESFETVLVETSSLPLHEGGRAWTDLQSWAAEHDYGATPDPEPADPDLWRVLLRRDDVAREARSLREEREALRREMSELRRSSADEVAALRQALGDAESAAEATRLELDATSSEAAALRQTLALAGAELRIALAERDAHLEAVAAARDDLEAALSGARGAQAALAAMQADRDASEAGLAAARAELDRATAESAVQRDALARAEAALDALSGEREAARRAHEQTRAQIEAVQTERAALQTALERERGAGAVARNERESARRDLAEVRVQQEVASKAVTAAENARREAVAALDQRTAELSELREDLRMALRMQRIAQSDLQHLQGRYDELLSKKHRADELLCEITRRLMQASRQLPAPMAASELAPPINEVSAPQRAGSRSGAGRRR